MGNVRCKLIIDIETCFADDESDAGTVAFCIKEDLCAGNSPWIINSIQTIDIQSGRWVEWKEKFPDCDLPAITEKLKHSPKLGVFCGYCEAHADNKYKFCPHCGSSMDNWELY